MAGTTTCPHCGTRFRISREQLEMHHGMVRCGNCFQAFDTRPHFAPEEIDPQLVLPILDEAYGQESASPSMPAHGAAASMPDIDDERGEHTPIDSPDLDLGSATDEAPSDKLTEAEPEVVAPAQPPASDESEFLAKPKARFWGVASFFLVLTLVLQAAYLFRIELAARLPALKPSLVTACEFLNCSVPLPRNADQMTIESSELKDEPGEGHQILLSALLRNRADYAQAFPDLELTLTDLRDAVLARRVFKPAEYLVDPDNVSDGLASGRELSVRLRLDTAELNPVGYRLALLY